MTRMPVSEMSAIAPRKSIDESRSSTTTSMYFRKRTPVARFSCGRSVIRRYRPGKIIRQDRPALRAGERHAAGAPLTEPHAVTEPAALHGHRSAVSCSVDRNAAHQQTGQHARSERAPHVLCIDFDRAARADKRPRPRAPAPVRLLQLDARDRAGRTQLLLQRALELRHLDRLAPRVPWRLRTVRARNALAVRQRFAAPRVGVRFRMPAAARRV